MKANGTQFSFRVFRLVWSTSQNVSPVYFGNFPLEQTKTALPFTFQLKSSNFRIFLVNETQWHLTAQLIPVTTAIDSSLLLLIDIYILHTALLNKNCYLIISK